MQKTKHAYEQNLFRHHISERQIDRHLIVRYAIISLETTTPLTYTMTFCSIVNPHSTACSWSLDESQPLQIALCIVYAQFMQSQALSQALLSLDILRFHSETISALLNLSSEGPFETWICIGKPSRRGIFFRDEITGWGCYLNKKIWGGVDNPNVSGIRVQKCHSQPIMPALRVKYWYYWYLHHYLW